MGGFLIETSSVPGERKNSRLSMWHQVSRSTQDVQRRSIYAKRHIVRPSKVLSALQCRTHLSVCSLEGGSSQAVFRRRNGP
jgi:hypothetical protein